MPLIDIGVNLAHDSFDADRAEVLARAGEAGVETLVITGTSVAGSERALELADPDQGRYTTAGVHPHRAKDYDDRAHARVRELAADPAALAVGETGLDFFRDFSPRADQQRAFERQLELAATLAMPVFLHQRDAHRRFVEILGAHRDALPAAVVHCFTGTREELYDYLDLDCHIGVTGWICDERRGAALRESVADIPASRLMLETDAPFLIPRDLPPQLQPTGHRRRNEPAFLPHILHRVADCRSEPPAEVASATTATARAFFRI